MAVFEDQNPAGTVARPIRVQEDFPKIKRVAQAAVQPSGT